MNIIKGSTLRVCDNSGAKLVQCIGIYNNKKIAKVGDVIMVVIKKCDPRGIVKKKTLHRAIIIQTKSNFLRGLEVFKFTINGAVLLKEDKTSPIGNRIFQKIPIEIKKQYPSIANIASKIY